MGVKMLFFFFCPYVYTIWVKGLFGYLTSRTVSGSKLDVNYALPTVHSEKQFLKFSNYFFSDREYST